LAIQASIALCAATFAYAEVVSLPSFTVDLSETSVSGLSSGGYMAVQFHIAHSSLVKGAGIIAAGPYFCAQDSQDVATSVCSCTGFAACQPASATGRVPNLREITDRSANGGEIDATSQLANDKVWLFSGRIDSVVPPPVMEALETYYKSYVPASNIFFKKDLTAEHAMPTTSFGNACSFRGEPFINDCNFDAAGELLQWIYGGLNPGNEGTVGGKFVEFDQSEFIANPASHGMWPSGWAYVPASCQRGEKCKVHVAFHGCRQYPGAPFPGHGKFGDTFVRNAGYNKWADTNDIIVLYPQANAMTLGTRFGKTNPLGCWDWWGFDDANYAKKSGRQIMAVKAMLDRIGGVSTPLPAGACGSASNLDHVTAGRAYTWFFWLYYAAGSNDFLGMSGASQTTLKESSPGFYERVASCP
jgi:poly(3-hydroxybutyrate) depolymerase